MQLLCGQLFKDVLRISDSLCDLSIVKVLIHWNSFSNVIKHFFPVKLGQLRMVLSLTVTVYSRRCNN